MKQGLVVERFDVKDKNGKVLNVVFRYPCMKDAVAALYMVNSARDEAEFLGQRHHETMKSEMKFVETQIENMRKRKGICLFVEIGGELVGDSIIVPTTFDASKHVGHFGIMLREKFTSHGIGKKLMEKMLQLAKKETRFKIIESSYFSENERSKKLHRKFGFKQYGVFPNQCKLKSGKYCDHMFVYKVIKKL